MSAISPDNSNSGSRYGSKDFNSAQAKANGGYDFSRVNLPFNFATVGGQAEESEEDTRSDAKDGHQSSYEQTHSK